MFDSKISEKINSINPDGFVKDVPNWDTFKKYENSVPKSESALKDSLIKPPKGGGSLLMTSAGIVTLVAVLFGAYFFSESPEPENNNQAQIEREEQVQQEIEENDIVESRREEKNIETPAVSKEETKEKTYRSEDIDSPAYLTKQCDMVKTDTKKISCTNVSIEKIIFEELRTSDVITENLSEGPLLVSMVVSPKGEVSKVSILTPYEKRVDAKVSEVLSALSGFSPGIKNGVKVPVEIIVPIDFKF